MVIRGVFDRCFTVSWPSYFWELLKDGVITGHVVGLDKHWTDRRHVRSDTFDTKICGTVEELLFFHIYLVEMVFGFSHLLFTFTFTFTWF